MLVVMVDNFTDDYLLCFSAYRQARCSDLGRDRLVDIRTVPLLFVRLVVISAGLGLCSGTFVSLCDFIVKRDSQCIGMVVLWGP